MKELTNAQLDEIFGAPVAPITASAPNYGAEAKDLLFREIRTRNGGVFLAPEFDMFPPAREIFVDKDTGEESLSSDCKIFDSFDNRRMIEEILDGTQYTRAIKKNGKPMNDEEFDNAINWRLSQITVRADGDISPTQAVSERFQSFESHRTGRLARDRGSLNASNFKHELASNTQFDRLLFEEGNLVGNEIKIVQLRTGDQTPSQFRPELVMTWAKCTFDQAVKLVECYRWIETTFETQRYLNQECSRRSVDHPAATTLSNWNDAVNVADRFDKIAERGGIANAKKYLRATRDELATRRGADFDERYPVGNASIIEIARAMKKLAKPSFEDATISTDIDLDSFKSVDDRYEQDEDGLFYDSAADADTVYINPDGSPIVIMETGHNDDESDSFESDDREGMAMDVESGDGGRDSEAFGYWHMSVIPTDQALIGDPAGIQFYLKAMRVVARTKSLKKLTKLRLCVFAAEVKWNYTQKKKFWAAFKLRQAEIKFEHKLLRDKKSAFLGQQAEEWFAENTRRLELPEFQNYGN